MDKFTITASSHVTEADVKSARLGTRFGRMDLASQLVLLAVETLGVDFGKFSPDRIAICLVARVGSLSTDMAYWNGREAVGGLSPTLFAYTLPSAAVGEIAIRHKLTGPNLCLVGDSEAALDEAEDLLRRGEADACVGIFCEVVSPDAGKLMQVPPAALAKAWFLQSVAHT
jgi:3-oxoacyl-(acyl-carrier-protein) synthase